MPASLPSAAIADAGPIIHLDELSLLALLSGFALVLVPETVALEAERHRPGWRNRAPNNISLEQPSAERITALMRTTKLDAGEAAAIALWEQHREAILLCDDLPARRYAESVGCSVAGTIGLVLWAARVGRIEVARARTLLLSIPHRTTLHIRLALLREAADSLDEG